MDKDFNKIFANTLKYEGGMDTTLAKYGTVSNFGITQDLYDAHNKQKGDPPKDVKDISFGEARDIGYTEFYERINAEKLKDPNLKAVLFDYAYNSGPSQAVKTLQETVGAKPDGIIGPKTKKKIKKYIEKNGDTSLIEEILSKREKYLLDLAYQNPRKHQPHLQGWMNRINDLRNTYLQ